MAATALFPAQREMNAKLDPVLVNSSTGKRLKPAKLPENRNTFSHRDNSPPSNRNDRLGRTSPSGSSRRIREVVSYNSPTSGKIYGSTVSGERSFVMYGESRRDLGGCPRQILNSQSFAIHFNEYGERGWVILTQRDLNRPVSAPATRAGFEIHATPCLHPPL